MINQTNSYNTLNQGVLPFFISDCLDICDPVFTFDELIGGMNLEKYLKNVPEHKLGRIRYNPVKMLKAVQQRQYEKLVEYTTKLNEYVTKSASAEKTGTAYLTKK